MYIHISDSFDDNVRMILPPSGNGQAPIVFTYTVDGLGNAQGMAFDGTHIHLADDADDNVRMILPPSANGQAPTVYTYTVDGVNNPHSMAFDGTHIHIADATDRNVRMILPPSGNGQAPIVWTYTVSGLTHPLSMTFDGTHIHIGDINDRNVRMILPPSADGQAPTVFTYTVSGLGNSRGAMFDGTHIHFADATDDNVRMILPPSADGQAPTVYTYTVDGVNNPAGMTFDGSIQNQATLTLSTTDTDIRSGEPVDIDIASDIDISNFVASDCTVTNGTRGALTINSVASATLRVTAGSAGTMTVAIAEDAVDPGNAAVSQDFTVNARVTATITFDDTEGESGGSTGVNIALSESVTGLLLSHLTASAGTLSNVTGSGTAWEADLAFPATGSGTIDIDLAIDSTTPQNAAASASIDYVASVVITVPSAPNSLALTKTHNSISVTFAAPTDLGNGIISRYDIRIDGGAWVDTGLDLAHTFSSLSAETEYTIDVAGVNSAGRGAIATLSATTDAAVVALSFGSESINNQAWVVGTAATITLPQATGGTGAKTYSLSPALPAGKTFTAGTRILDGNPTATFTLETFTYTATDENNDIVTLTFTIVVDAEDEAAELTVTITGGTNIEQGDEITLSATVVDENGNTPVGDLEYAWSASRGSFVGATDEASAEYSADFTDSSDVEITITCDVTRVADTTPTVSEASLTAMTELGITGQILNMLIDPTRDALDDAQVAIYDNVNQLTAGSDDDLTSTILISRVQWDDNREHLVFNQSDNTDSLASFWETNTTQSIFLIFEDGTVHEITNSDFDSGGAYWSRWNVDNTSIIQMFVDLSNTTSFLVGVGDIGSIGLVEETGSDTEIFIASATTGPDLIVVPSAPTSLTLTKTHNSISATFAAPTNNGGEDPSRYDIRIDGGAWVDTGLDLAHTFSSLSAETEYTVDVAGVNSAGRGAIATLSTTTNAAPIVVTVPSAPTSLALTKTHNSISATFAAPTNLGNGIISRYDIRIDGGSWVDTGLDLTHTFSTLSAETEYTVDVAAVNSAGRGAIATLSATTDAEDETVATSGNIHVIDNSGDEVAVLPTNTADGVTAVASRTYLLPTQITSPEGGVLVDGNIHVADNTGDEVAVIPTDTADGDRVVADRIYRLPTGITSPRGIAVDADGNIHVVNRSSSGSSVAVLPPDTANGVRAVAIRTYLLPTTITSPEGAVDADGNIHFIDNSGDEVAVIPPDTANGVRAVAIRTYLLPTGLNSPRGITLDGDGNLHVANNTGDEVSVIPSDVADGVTAVAIRTYFLPTGITSPEGLVFVPDSEPVVTVPSAPTSLALTKTHNSISATFAAPTNNGGEDPSRYDIRIDGGAWVDTGLDLAHTFDNLEAETEYTVDVAGVNSAGRGATVSLSATTNVAPVVIIVPSAPTSLALTKTYNSISATFASPTNLGGAALSQYDIRIDDGAWINTGLDLAHTFDNLEAETEYTVDVAGVNSAGRGAIATLSTTTNAAPIVVTVPSAPTSLALTKTHNSISATFAAPTNLGNGIISRYDIRIDSGAWVDTGLDLAHTFSSLSAETEYTVDVAGVNSAGRGAIATLSATTDAETVLPNIAPEFANTSYTFNDVGITLNTVIGTVAATDDDNDTLTYSLTGTDTDKFNIDSSGEITVAEALDYGEAYSINVVANDGTDDTSVGVTINAETVSPRTPTIVVDSTTEDSATITITAGNNGGESVTDWEYELDADDTWISFGSADLEQTISNLDSDVEYSIKVRGINSEGNGDASAAVTATTDASLNFGIETIDDQVWIVGTDVSVDLPMATGGTGTIVYSLSPTTPTGVAFTASIPDLDGNPTATFTSTEFTYTATDNNGNGDSVELAFTIVVNAAVVLVSTTSTELTYNASMGYNILPENIGALKKISDSGVVESLGNLWYTDRPYNAALTRPLSIDGSLHITMGYGNPNEVLRYNSLASKADNFAHLIFGNKLIYIVPTFSPNGNLYSKLATLAYQVGATLSFDGNIISIIGRRAFRAKTDGMTGIGTGDLDFDNENKAFPSIGYLHIGNEFIEYTGISNGSFTGVTRGALGSEIVNHTNNTNILYLNTILSDRDVLQINKQTDTTRHANIIRDGENVFEVSDETSIAQYRNQPYTLNLGLTRNEDAWIETLFKEYLSELKNLGSVFELKLRPQKKPNALDLGQIIGLRYGYIPYSLRIESISYSTKMIDIEGRTVEV